MTQLSLLAEPTAPPGAVVESAMGLPLRKLLGAWTAAGHVFDEKMLCSLCRRSYLLHQMHPAPCPSLSDNRRAEKLAQRRKLVAASKESSKRLRLLWKHCGLTQDELADRAGCTRNSLACMVRGTAAITAEVAAKLSAVFCDLRSDSSKDVTERYLRGASQERISDELQIPISRVRRLLPQMPKPKARVEREAAELKRRRRDRKRKQDRARTHAQRRAKREENL